MTGPVYTSGRPPKRKRAASGSGAMPAELGAVSQAQQSPEVLLGSETACLGLFVMKQQY